jgi:hypothetical protein
MSIVGIPHLMVPARRFDLICVRDRPAAAAGARKSCSLARLRPMTYNGIISAIRDAGAFGARGGCSLHDAFA